MSENIFVKPGAGRVVHLPGTNIQVPDEGIEVEHSPYWLRRIDDGDVWVVSPAKAKSTALAAAKDS